MERYIARARRLRHVAAACAGLAAILLAVAIVLNENAVNYEDRVTGDPGIYPTTLALALSLLAAALAMRSAANPATRGVAASFVIAILAGVIAFVGGLINGTEGVFVNIEVCLARGDVWLAVYMKPTPGSCPPNQIPLSEESLFYPGMWVALAAAAVLVVGVFMLFIGRKRWQPAVPVAAR